MCQVINCVTMESEAEHVLFSRRLSNIVSFCHFNKLYGVSQNEVNGCIISSQHVIHEALAQTTLPCCACISFFLSQTQNEITSYTVLSLSGKACAPTSITSKTSLPGVLLKEVKFPFAKICHFWQQLWVFLSIKCR